MTSCSRAGLENLDARLAAKRTNPCPDTGMDAAGFEHRSHQHRGTGGLWAGSETAFFALTAWRSAAQRMVKKRGLGT